MLGEGIFLFQMLNHLESLQQSFRKSIMAGGKHQHKQVAHEQALRVGFGPTRGNPIAFQVQLLNHSDIAAFMLSESISEFRMLDHFERLRQSVPNSIVAHYHEVNISINKSRSEERRVGKECRSRWSPYH